MQIPKLPHHPQKLVKTPGEILAKYVFVLYTYTCSKLFTPIRSLALKWYKVQSAISARFAGCVPYAVVMYALLFFAGMSSIHSMPVSLRCVLFLTISAQYINRNLILRLVLFLHIFGEHAITSRLPRSAPEGLLSSTVCACF